MSCSYFYVHMYMCAQLVSVQVLYMYIIYMCNIHVHVYVHVCMGGQVCVHILWSPTEYVYILCCIAVVVAVVCDPDIRLFLLLSTTEYNIGMENVGGWVSCRTCTDTIIIFTLWDIHVHVHHTKLFLHLFTSHLHLLCHILPARHNGGTF